MQKKWCKAYIPKRQRKMIGPHLTIIACSCRKNDKFLVRRNLFVVCLWSILKKTHAGWIWIVWRKDYHSTATEMPWIHFISSWLRHRVTEGANLGLDSWFAHMCHRSAFLMSRVLDTSPPKDLSINFTTDQKNLSINFATDHNFKVSLKCAAQF